MNRNYRLTKRYAALPFRIHTTSAIHSRFKILEVLVNNVHHFDLSDQSITHFFNA